MRRTVVAAFAALTVALTMAGSSAAEVEQAQVTAVVAGPFDQSLAGGDVLPIPYTHRDCVGPGLPGTRAPHITHTDTVTGLRIGAGIIRFVLTPLTPFGSGICPLTAGGPVLQEDFTGTYRVTAVCRGISDGVVFLDWEISAIAGLVQSQASTGGICSGPFGAQWSLDVTVAISGTSFLGVPLPPAGGIRLGISQ